MNLKNDMPPKIKVLPPSDFKVFLNIIPIKSLFYW